MPREPAWLTSAARDGGAQAASRERRAAGTDPPAADWSTQRTPGDGTWATPTSVTLTREVQARLACEALPGLRTPDDAVGPHHVPAAAVGNVPVAIVRRMSVSACRFRSL